MPWPREGIQKWTCAHDRLTDADSEGYALCPDCGAAVVKHVTLTILHRAFDAVRNQARGRDA